MVLKIFYVILGLNIQFFFLLERELLFSKKSALRVLVLNLILFLLGNLLYSLNFSDERFTLLLKMPFVSQLLLYLLFVVFIKFSSRPPKDTFWSMDINLLKDGLFNFTFWVLGIVVPVYLIFKGYL